MFIRVAMIMTPIKISRLSMRISQEDKETLELAAASKGVSPSSYILSAAMEKAEEDLRGEREIELTRQSWNQLMDLIENPPKPNEALQELLKQ